MAKWVLFAYTDCAEAAREREFNEWYDKVHVPDILQMSGFISATRYVNINPKVTSDKFLAIYEVESDDMDKTVEALKERGAQLEKQGRVTDLLIVGPIVVYRQLSSMTNEPSRVD